MCLIWFQISDYCRADNTQLPPTTHAHGADPDTHYQHPLTFWTSPAPALQLSARQFVSLSQFLCPSGEQHNWDEVMWQADLCEVWTKLQLAPGPEQSPDTRQWRTVPRRREEDTLTLARAGRWWWRKLHTSQQTRLAVVTGDSSG